MVMSGRRSRAAWSACIHSLATKRMTSFRCKWNDERRTSMERTRAVRDDLLDHLGMAPTPPRSTKPNSPPAAKPEARADGVAGSAPGARKDADDQPLDGQEGGQTRDEPPVGDQGLHVEPHADGDEKKPHEHVAEGLDVPSTWTRYSVSEISMPATKAPRARDRPASSVIWASPRVMRRTLRTKTSDDLARATTWNQRRMRCWPNRG